MNRASLLRLAPTPLLVLLAWIAWDRGGMLLGWIGLDALDVPGRLCLVFAVLGIAERLLARLPALTGDSHP